MGYADEAREISDTYKRFERDAKGWSKMTSAEKAKTLASNVYDFISRANECIENSTRIGIFAALREKGVPVQEAIKFAREATVDFNRKGTAMPWFNGLYMFANAAMQGGVRSLQAFRDDFADAPATGLGSGRRKGELTGTLIALGVAGAVLNHYFGNDDEREKQGGRNARNLTEYDKKHLLGVPVPGVGQVNLMRIRGPYAAIPYVARTITDVILGETKPGDAAKNLAAEAGSQLVDVLGGNGVGSKSELLQTLAPSVADPFVQLATGMDYKGDMRVRRTFDKTKPASWNGRDNTGAAFKATAQFINRITGGNENRKGVLDWAPEDIELAWDSVFGGVGRDVSNLEEGVEMVYRNLVKGERTDNTVGTVPFLKDIVKEYPESTRRYFSAMDRYDADKAEFKRTTDMKRRAELKRRHPYLTSGKGRVDALKEQVEELRHLEKGEVKRGNKWVEKKQPISADRKNEYRRRRLKAQATALRILGE